MSGPFTEDQDGPPQDRPGDQSPAGEPIGAGRIFAGHMSGEGMRVALACSRFNGFITARLLGGAIDALVRHGVDPADATAAWAPGAFELPLLARALAMSGEHDAVVCLGAVIRGATGHYEHVAGQCAAGIQRVQLDTGVPVVFGVLTTDTLEQAIERAGAKAGNKGAEAACAAIEMVDLLRRLPGPGPGPSA